MIGRRIQRKKSNKGQRDLYEPSDSSYEFAQETILLIEERRINEMRNDILATVFVTTALTFMFTMFGALAAVVMYIH